MGEEKISTTISKAGDLATEVRNKINDIFEEHGFDQDEKRETVESFVSYVLYDILCDHFEGSYEEMFSFLTSFEYSTSLCFSYDEEDHELEFELNEDKNGFYIKKDCLNNNGVFKLEHFIVNNDFGAYIDYLDFYTGKIIIRFKDQNNIKDFLNYLNEEINNYTWPEILE